MNIVLIGYRGSGKTTVGQIISKSIGYNLFSSDRLIETKIGMTIREFVEKNNWDAFRDLESSVIEEISKNDKIVIDTGGGVILREKNMLLLKRNGILFFLNAHPEILSKRIKNEYTRPPLKNGKQPWDEVVEVLKERLPLYNKYADYTIDTSYNTPFEISSEIINIFKRHR